MALFQCTDISTEWLSVEKKPLHETLHLSKYGQSSPSSSNVTTWYTYYQLSTTGTIDTSIDTSEAAAVYCLVPSLDWTLCHTTLSLLSLLFLITLLQRHVVISDPGDELSLVNSDPVTSDVTDGLVERLQALTLGPAHKTEGLSWLRRARDVQLISSPVNPLTSSVIDDSLRPVLVCPARLRPPRAGLVSATASLSLSDQNSQFNTSLLL